MKSNHQLDKIAISVQSHKLLQQLLTENPKLEEIMRVSRNETEALIGVRQWGLAELKLNPEALTFYNNKNSVRSEFEKLKWKDFAVIRILDYVDNAGREFSDLNLRGASAVSNPMKLIWLAVNFGTGGAKPDFFRDMLHLFRQFSGVSTRTKPTFDDLQVWMERFPSGLDERIEQLHKENKERIVNIIIDKIDAGEITDSKYFFDPDMSYGQKVLRIVDWWEDHKFHLRFAVRNPKTLNEYMGGSLDPDTMKRLNRAESMGIPFFINLYYLSLMHVRKPYFAIGSDLAIRDYVIYSDKLLEEYGNIVAWEKEDVVEEGKPNAAGWILPAHHNVHRRYPEVAILIPDTIGRACGGLCASCQRMYDFQSGHLNFNLYKLKPKQTWSEKLKTLLDYWENDSQLRDILITGGDALMSTDKSLEKMLDGILEMAKKKILANKKRPEGEKYAELVRVRLGTRLPIYLPQRITPELTKILADFKAKASALGIKQFLIQTHYETSMEITPMSKLAVERLISAGWTVTNQHVFTAASSRRGHTAKLRKDLNEIGVLTYYTFSVKGYTENTYNFATNERAVQEQIEEKVFGIIPKQYHQDIRQFPLKAENMVENIEELLEKSKLPFLATDRNVLNLPGVGKSLTFRTIGITRYGRRILEFDHDATRNHSPIIHKMGKVIIVESKSISEYMEQLEQMAEDISEYTDVWGYSAGSTEPRQPIYEYPEYEYISTKEYTNLDIGE
ncbi:MAG: KamA family protein [Candidatus Kapabacteria bacterium]|jgi:lysine 2,3-aminomutase|nr:KamA family protein [Candidatus Kapabacteria bacterium]